MAPTMPFSPPATNNTSEGAGLDDSGRDVIHYNMSSIHIRGVPHNRISSVTEGKEAHKSFSEDEPLAMRDLNEAEGHKSLTDDRTISLKNQHHQSNVSQILIAFLYKSHEGHKAISNTITEQNMEESHKTVDSMQDYTPTENVNKGSCSVAVRNDLNKTSLHHEGLHGKPTITHHLQGVKNSTPHSADIEELRQTIASMQNYTLAETVDKGTLPVILHIRHHYHQKLNTTTCTEADIANLHKTMASLASMEINNTLPVTLHELKYSTTAELESLHRILTSIQNHTTILYPTGINASSMAKRVKEQLHRYSHAGNENAGNNLLILSHGLVHLTEGYNLLLVRAGKENIPVGSGEEYHDHRYETSEFFNKTMKGIEHLVKSMLKHGHGGLANRDMNKTLVGCGNMDIELYNFTNRRHFQGHGPVENQPSGHHNKMESVYTINRHKFNNSHHHHNMTKLFPHLGHAKVNISHTRGQHIQTKTVHPINRHGNRFNISNALTSHKETEKPSQNEISTHQKRRHGPMRPLETPQITHHDIALNPRTAARINSTLKPSAMDLPIATRHMARLHAQYKRTNNDPDFDVEIEDIPLAADKTAELEKRNIAIHTAHRENMFCFPDKAQTYRGRQKTYCESQGSINHVENVNRSRSLPRYTDIRLHVGTNEYADIHHHTHTMPTVQLRAYEKIEKIGRESTMQERLLLLGVVLLIFGVLVVWFKSVGRGKRTGKALRRRGEEKDGEGECLLV